MAKAEDIANMVIKNAQELIKSLGYGINFPDSKKPPICFRPLVLSDLGLLRIVRYHNVGKQRLACLGEGCGMCARASEIQALDKEKWFGVNTSGVCQGYLVNVDANGHVSGKFGGIGMRWGGIVAFNEFLSELSPETATKMFNYFEPSRIICLADHGDRHSVTFAETQVAVPAIPGDFPELKDYWVAEKPTDGELTKALEFLANELVTAKKKSESSGPIHPAPGAPADAHGPSAPVGPSIPASAPAEGKKECYGKGWKLCQECLMCGDETPCRPLVKAAAEKK